jgi:hypothetical protein
MNDPGVERIRKQLEFVNDELYDPVGLGGRDRRISDQPKRTRLQIGKAIRSALKGIRRHDPSFAYHPFACIRSGTIAPTFQTASADILEVIGY